MFTLVARDPMGRVVASVRVTNEQQMIGRAPECALVLPSTGVSRRHASFYLHDDGVVISDEGSANGVKVDGQLITAPTLVDHTNRLQISGFLLSLEPDADVGVGWTPPTAEAAGDTDEERIDFDTRLEAHTGAASAIANSMLELVGRGGAYDGTHFSLDSPLLTVGRDESNDLVLEDPSVSRRHAQLRLSVLGDRATVLDLRSHNGTFVDGERITKRADAMVGAVIRFGDLAFRLDKLRVGQARRGATRRMSPRGRLAAALGFLIVILAVVGFIAHRNRPKPTQSPVRPVIDVLQERQAKIQAMVEQARRKLELRQWAAAIAELRAVLEKDPLNNEAKRLVGRASDEQDHQRTFQEGMRYFGLGNRENMVKARGIFGKIPKNSVYHSEVRYRLKAIDTEVAQGHRIEGVSRCKARYWRECQQALCQFFSLLSAEAQVPGEPGLRRMLQGAERRLRRQRGFEPCKARRFLSPPTGDVRGDDPDELLAQRYPDVEDVRPVLRLYITGNIDGALNLLGKLRAKRAMRPHATLLAEINRQLLVIRGKYQEGYSAYRERKAAETDRLWETLLATDRALLATGIESFHRREVRRMLGDLYFELGEEQYKAHRYRLAARYWHRGNEVNAGHLRVLNGLLQLEKTAEQLIADGQQDAAAGRPHDARNKLTLARDICRAASPTRARADKALANLGN